MMQSMSMLAKIQDCKAVKMRLKDKDLKILDEKTKSKDNDKGLTTKSNLIDLTKECHNELTSGEIARTGKRACLCKLIGHVYRAKAQVIPSPARRNTKVPNGRYVVLTGRVIGTVSIKVPTG
ncbi:hypothetical protein Tco_1037393, partial [Tanacetum coccineum]